MDMKEKFRGLIQSFTTSPILFVGSGISLRYLNTETWGALLKKFSDEIGQTFEKYKSQANGNWPEVGKLIANDFHELWFTDERYKELKEENLHEMEDIASPLKVAISKHLMTKTKGLAIEDNRELKLLKTANIDSIITTNYDLFLETIFPDFKVYTSQAELIFSSIHEIGEIYKIHGCVSNPNSIILTSDDYKDFNSKNAYLAAKLLTLFVEHPVLFLGYSITDNNIRTILSSIVGCLNQSQISELADRLFFVEYVEGLGETIEVSRFDLDIGGTLLPITRIKADSFVPIFEVLNEVPRRFPASVLRRIKEHIYELVATNDPSGKIKVIDIEDGPEIEEVDVVLGVGIQSQEIQLSSEKSYDSFGRIDIAKDILDIEDPLDPVQLLSITLPKLARAKTWLPVAKYINGEAEENINPKVWNAAASSVDKFRETSLYYDRRHAINDKYDSLEALIKDVELSKALNMIPSLHTEKVDIEILKQFLIDNMEPALNSANNKSLWMKLVWYYDRLKYGGRFGIALPAGSVS